MSLAAEAFVAALGDLHNYQPSYERAAAVTYSPKRRTSPTGSEPGRAYPVPAGPILRSTVDLRLRRTTSSELVAFALAAMAQHDGDLHAVVTLMEASARKQATTSDAAAANGKWLGALHGIPISVKDVIHVAGVPTYAGSEAYHQTPDADAEAVTLLRKAGATLIAKVSTHEFALGVTCPQSRHPRDHTRIPGGSSGGSAISVATGMALGSLGTDTRASIRVPAALCGMVGFKPTFGLVPARGIVQLSWTMDHVAPIGATVADAAYIMDVLTGASNTFLAQSAIGVEGLRVGVALAGFEGADPDVVVAVRKAIGHLESAGVEIVNVPVPSDKDFGLANAAGLIVSRCEALAYHRALGTDFSRLWPETRDQLTAAEAITARDYLLAQQLRADLAARMRKAFAADRLTAVVMPTTLVVAPPVKDAEKYLTVLSRNAIPWSFIGWPAMTVPCPTEVGGLPVGLQLVAPPFEESTLIRLGCSLERSCQDPEIALTEWAEISALVAA